MSVRIASNISSLVSQRRLGEATSELSKVSERLSSGLRITRAADDAAGLQISEGLKSDSKVFSQAVRNVNDGLSLLNIAQGAVQELSSIVTRQAELAEQAANGVYGVKQRLAMHTEANALVREYNRIVRTTSFNGIQTLNGVTGALRMQFGYGGNGGFDVAAGAKMGFAAGDATYGSVSAVGDPLASVTAAAAGDINNDGKTDLLINPDGTFATLLGNGDGTFSIRYLDLAPTLDVVELNDFNNDGKLDALYYSSAFPSSARYVALGNGDGTFRARVSYALTGHAASMISDINGDDIDDIFYVPTSDFSINMLFGNGDGTFRVARSQAGGGNSAGFELSDVNNDGIKDFISIKDDAIAVMLGNGNGSFRAATTYFGAGPWLYHVSVGDVNDDGISDIVSTDGAQILIFTGNGDGTFRVPQTVEYFTMIDRPVKVADANGDGLNDFFVFDASYTVNVLVNNGDGTFLLKSSILAQPQPEFLLEDFNNDGITDVLTRDASLQLSLGGADSSGRRNNFLSPLDLMSKKSARAALVSSKAALTRIGAELGNLGAFQSRLSVAGSNLLTARENFDSARSQLVDADVATESARLTSTRIRQQAAASVLAQANQQPALALKLLGRG